LFCSTRKICTKKIGLDGKVCSTQEQSALTAVINVMKGSFWIIIFYCFFTVGSVKLWQLSFLWFLLRKNWRCSGF